MLLPHKTTRLMCLQPTQAAERLFHCFSHQIFQQIAVGLLHFFHLFWMITNLKILQHLLSSSPLPLHLVSTLAFVQMEEKAAETKSHSDSAEIQAWLQA